MLTQRRERCQLETSANLSYVLNTIIEFRDVEYQIRIKNAARPILSGISLQIHSGETIALLGRSGSGKTTLLKLINGLRQSSRGAILVEGRPIPEWDVIELRRRIG